MVKSPVPPPDSSPPQEFPQAPPRDLYPTSDIRFVIVEIAKLTALVERLISDVKAHDAKLDELRQQATYIKGGFVVGAAAIGFFGWLVSAVIDGKMQAILTALSAVRK